MKPELQEKWCAALESNEYVQARSMLKRSAREMCCLGVLRDIMDPTNTRGTGFLHEEDLVAAGLSAWRQNELATMNDGGQTFAQIAAFIRSISPEEM